jgi:hypothetical protein
MKPFLRTFLVGAGVSVAATAITLTMDSWAPPAYRWLESIGGFAYKPWIFFAPGLVALLVAAAAVPRYRNRKSLAALLLGGIVTILVAGAALMVLIMTSLPNMHY